MDPNATAIPAWVDRQAYPFQSHSLELPAGRMHYLDEGRGRPVLLVHGTPTWSFEWRHLIPGLSQDHRVIAPDHLGFGLSERPAGFGYRPEDHAANLAAFVDRLGLDDLTLVVHDYGGPIALPLALDGSRRVSRLVVLNSWMWSFEDQPDMRRKARLAGGAFGRFLYRRLNFSLKVLTPSVYGDRKKLTPAIHRQYLAPFPDAESRGRVLWPLARALLGSSGHYAALWERRARLRELPALIIWGLRDSAFRPQQLARWRQTLPAAEVLELPLAGHWPHEEAPAEVLSAVRRFLDADGATGERRSHVAR
jgi:pimeloyl-ACP methyl ester carboxylesterase